MPETVLETVPVPETAPELNIGKSFHDHRPVMLGDPFASMIRRDLRIEWGDPSCDVSGTQIPDRWMQLPSDNLLTAKGVIK